MATPHFLFINSGEEQFPPAAFGYWSVRWSDKLAHSFLDGINDGDIDGCATYMQSFVTYLQLVAMYTASYWAYTAYVLNVSDQSVVEEMGEGLKDSIKEFHVSDGTPFTDELIDVFRSSFQKYFKAIGDDMIYFNNQAGGFNPDICNLSKLFIEAIEFYNFNDNSKMGEIEKTYYGHLVADTPMSVFNSLKQQGLIFQVQ